MLGFLKKIGRKKKRVVVIGIDGVPFSLIKRFMAEGVMPNFSKLTEIGTISEMTASIPEVSSTSWSTFMTGVNPGKHGIYGFMELQEPGYKWKFPNFLDLKSDTLWDIAGKNGKRSVVINIPSTYPARPLNGIITAGFVALDLKKATYPEEAYKVLQNMGYRLDVDTKKAKESLQAFANDIMETFKIRKKAILHFFDNEEWDLFIGVITETDRLHHYLWNALDDIDHPQYRFFRDFYREIDSFIGEIYKRVGDDIPFIILSDHGFTAIKQEVYLNFWLKEKGYLSFSKENPESFDDITEDSKIFVLDPARFYIHLKGKYPRGSVRPEEYEELRQKIKEELNTLTVDGEKVIKKIYFKEELYTGPLLDQAPDIVVIPNKGYDLKGSISKERLYGRGPLTGGHTHDDAMFYINRKIKVDNVNIIDIGPTIISLLDIEVQLDGRILIS